MIHHVITRHSERCIKRKENILFFLPIRWRLVPAGVAGFRSSLPRQRPTFFPDDDSFLEAGTGRAGAAVSAAGWAERQRDPWARFGRHAEVWAGSVNLGFISGGGKNRWVFNPGRPGGVVEGRSCV